MFQQKYEDIVVLIRTNRTDKTGLVMFRTIRTVRTVSKCCSPLESKQFSKFANKVDNFEDTSDFS